MIKSNGIWTTTDLNTPTVPSWCIMFESSFYSYYMFVYDPKQSEYESGTLIPMPAAGLIVKISYTTNLYLISALNLHYTAQNV